jgi:hypothetical protein
MAIKSIKNKTRSGSLLMGNAPYVPPSFESIASLTGNGSIGTYTFSSIPSTYTSLQIRMSVLKSAGSGEMRLRINGDTGSNYVWHNLSGYNGTASARGGTAQSYIQISSNVSANADMSTTYPSVAIIDIHNYTISTQNKTVKSWGGVDQNTATNSDINLNSGLWLNTSAITSLTVYYSAASNLASGTTISLYGIKG